MQISKVLAAALLASVVACPRAQGETPQTGPTYVVNTTDDHNDGVCGDVDCTLREALMVNGMTKTIQFAPNVTGTITLTGGQLSAAGNLTITGPGADRLTVDANSASRVLQCTSGNISISGLTLARGAVVSNDKSIPAVGGCILNLATLTLNACAIKDNTATGASTGAGTGGAIGGGIFNDDQATVSLFNCTLSGNAAVGGSGPPGTINIAGDLGRGGAIYNNGLNGSVSITNSTISGNVAMGGNGSVSSFGGDGGNSVGGAIYDSGSLIIFASTITGNSAVGGRGGGTLFPTPDGLGTTGGIYHLNFVGTTASCRSSVIAGNKDDAANLGGGPSGSNFDFFGHCTSQGFNLIGNADASPGSFATATDHTGTAAAPLDPKFDPLGLRDNGGPTLTVALQAASIAVNNGAPDAPGRDQRGYIRSGAPDIGAFEFGGSIPASLANISTRGLVGIGDDVMIGGFIVTGNGNKLLLLRAKGPSMSSPPFNLTNTLADPTLSLFSGATRIGFNDNWADASNAQSIDPALRPTNGLESAILLSLAPGAYTAIVRGVNSGTGIGLIEVFDLDSTATSKLINISTRGLVETGDSVLIGGFIVKGPDSEKVLVRAIGPTLANAPFNLTNVLQNPTLSLFDANGMVFASNDDWRSHQEADIIATGLQPADNAESAIVTTLLPGSYTAIVQGVNGTIGIALVEVYGLN